MNFVGDIVAAVVATNRYVAEDAAELVEVDYEPLPPVLDPEQAIKPGAPLIHEEWGDNIMLSSQIANGDVNQAFAQADVTVKARYQMNRHCAAPMEGRGVLAYHDPVTRHMTVWTSSQMPHMVRTKIAEAIDFPEHNLRVVTPDVGGGFGMKSHIFPEELILSMLTWELGRPVKWVEDRRENLYGSYHAKDEICYAELALKKDGTILGLKTRFIGDIGAYTSYPWTPSFEPLQAALACPGPYKINAVHMEAIAVATNKTTSSVYRGVGLPAAQYTMEHIMDEAAAKLGMDPAELRRKNIMSRKDFPCVSVTGLEYDSASPLESLDMALEMINYEKFRKEQAEARKQGRYLGLGLSTMIEMTVFGYEYWRKIGWKSVSGYDSAHIRVDPNGGITLSVGTHSHGQGHHSAVKILRYVVAEDCGRMINPLIVEGQIAGGVAQGIGVAMLEHLRYDENGQILTTSLMDYLIPSAADIPNIEYGHLETPCPVSVGGIKGMGEGGAVAPPPALANAICDALSPFGWKPITKLLMTLEVVHSLVAH